MIGDKGMMITCTKCQTNLFLKYLGKEDFDGGWTTSNKFEKVPDDWLYATQFGYLCPECANKFKTLMTEFFDGKVAPIWNINKSNE